MRCRVSHKSLTFNLKGFETYEDNISVTLINDNFALPQFFNKKNIDLSSYNM